MTAIFLIHQYLAYFLIFNILPSIQSISSPQLNLPPLSPISNDNNNNNNLPTSPSLGGSYSPNRPSDRLNFEDNNRSQRYGPPYSNDDDSDRPSDIGPNLYNGFRNNISSNSIYSGYGYGNPNVPGTQGYNYNLNNNPNIPSIPSIPNPLDVDRRYSIDTEKIRRLLLDADQKGSQECTANVLAQWNFETNVNELTQADALLAQQRYSDYRRSVVEQIRQVDRNLIYDENLLRQIRLLTLTGPNALSPEQLDRYNRLINDMLAIYNEASICRFEQPFQCDLRLQPDLKAMMAHSRDWDELQHAWTEWRRKAGKPMRGLFEQLVELMSEISTENGYQNAGDYWLAAYEQPNIREDLENVWTEIQPLYELLHAYVRRKLREYYGPDKINRNAPLPEHILGNMYGQNWNNILDITIPYPGRNFIDVTRQMLIQGYSPLIMFQLAEEFFLSMNMTALPPEFWLNSILEQPIDRPILCQPSSWDFCSRHDYRIKMCAQVNHRDLINAHHELSHIHYFLSYRHHPKVYRDGANPGFHEAIGDAIGLSVSTPRHLQTLGLVQNSVDDTYHDINFLYAMAVDKLAFLPFALALEGWRTDVFNRRISKEQYNCHFWILRERYGGIKPPVLRSEMDFDPGAKYHVAANIPYVKFFVGTVLQFQIYRAICRATRQYNPDDPQKPLHKCDFYKQPEAGNMLKKLMEKGASQPWQQTLYEVTGEGQLSGNALREYFRPLEEWLRSENLRNQEFVGWTYDGDYCKHSIETANLQVFGGFYNKGVINAGASIILVLIITLFRHLL